jgi:hypothetical protein
MAQGTPTRPRIKTVVYPGVAAPLENYDLEVTYAILFDRPTTLEDGEHGLHNWLKMFGAAFTENLPAEQREAALAAVEREARPRSLPRRPLVMDYRRLRVVAKRNTPSAAI